ncbi:hypothetical protein R6Q57_027172 [Mikania cordata]
MSTSTSPFSQSFSCRPSFPSTPKLKYITHSSLHRTACVSSFSSSSSSSRPLKNNWRFSCFKDENLDYDGIPETAGDTVDQEPNQLDVKHHWPLKLRKAVDVIFSAEPWTVPWTAKTVIQISQLKVKTSARMNTNFGNASLDCFILVGRVLDIAIFRSHSRSQKGYLNIQRTGILQSFGRCGGTCCRNCNSSSLSHTILSSVT